ncbi:DUF5381 family protein [Neobacillus dielmonensis]|uniref:DUF5381 family protein n=1 Tax=Neobacillus dielmonensis TaxID=1347369 RepID=UPI0005A9AC9C|nr:DUF5381 family protein [Neobacillus dielmonensis]
MENNIKVTNGKVEIVFLPIWAGCMVFGTGLMTLAGLFILFYIVPDSSIARAFAGIIIGIPATLFFATKLLQLLSAILAGKTLIAIENGVVIGRKNQVAIQDIKDIYWSGLSFKILNIHTTNNKRIKLNTYNLLSEDVIEHAIETYIIPQATPELKNNWEKRVKQGDGSPASK